MGRNNDKSVLCLLLYHKYNDNVDIDFERLDEAAHFIPSGREEILANTKVMMEMVCETDSLDMDLK